MTCVVVHCMVGSCIKLYRCIGQWSLRKGPFRIIEFDWITLSLGHFTCLFSFSVKNGVEEGWTQVLQHLVQNHKRQICTDKQWLCGVEDKALRMQYYLMGSILGFWVATIYVYYIYRNVVELTEFYLDTFPPIMFYFS